MAKIKDIIIRRNDGLFVMKQANGQVGFTNKINATHFTGTSAARKQCPTLNHFSGLRYIDLNDRRRLRK